MNLKLNADRFSGKDYVQLYDKYRPTPPLEIIHQTLNYLNKNRADTIVDLGCGTGLSTAVWKGFSSRIIGVEPSQAMIEIAQRKAIENASYLLAYSDKISLPDQSVEIVACSQAFHWMEPVGTLKEVNRILQPGGVFVIIDAFWPPSVNYKMEDAYCRLFQNIDRISDELKEKLVDRWKKEAHIKNVKKSNYFKFTKETYFHKTEPFTKEQFIGIALSQGGLEALLKRGFSPKEIGIDDFENQIMGIEDIPFQEITYNYRVIFGVK